MAPLRSCLIGILAAFSLSFATASAGSRETNPVLTHPGDETQPLGFLVKFRATGPAGTSRDQVRSASTTESDVQSLSKRSNLTLKQTRRIAAGLHLMQVSPGDSAAGVLARLRADPAVESVDVDRRLYAHAMPNDPLYAQQWYEQNNQPAAIDALTAWDTTTGRSDIVIADLDTGVRFDHPDLGPAGGPRLLAGYDFITDPVVANDGDGRDADASDPGDWVSSADVATTKFSKCKVQDSSWHGTRTAGILGAITNNSNGIAGITWGAKILPLRVLGKCGGADSDILDAMRWAAGLHVDGVPDNTHPAQIINMSLGATGACTSAEQIVINEVLARGVLVVVSAGNEGGPVDAPANCVGVAGIAGLRNVGTKVGFSSLGPEISLAAPAGNCVNASGSPCVYPIDTTSNAGTTTPTINGYTDQLNPSLGTSFSAPIVSGIAALMASVNSNLTAPQLVARLKEGATTFPVSSDTTVPNCHVPSGASDLQTAECNCTTHTCGAGMANAPGALKAASRPIAALSVPASVSAGQNVTLSALGSAAACGHTIASYAWSIVGSSTTAIQGAANTPSATVVAPTSGSITVQVTVTDDAGLTDTAQATVSSTGAATAAPAAANNGTCPASPVTVAVSPATASLVPGANQLFTATLTNTTNVAVSWEVNGVVGGSAALGTITTAGMYTAPTTVTSAVTVTITAVSAADAGRSGSAQVTVTPAAAGGGSSGSNGSTARSAGGGGSSGGGGSVDALMLLALGALASCQALRRIQPGFLRPTIMRRRDARLFEQFPRYLARIVSPALRL